MEATFICIISIYILVALIDMTFFLHDQTVIRARMTRAMIEKESEKKMDEDCLVIKNISYEDTDSLIYQQRTAVFQIEIKDKMLQRFFRVSKKKQIEVKRNKHKPAELLWDATLLKRR